MGVNVLDESNFETEISASGVYLVDFWAEWCGPCQMMLPVLDSFAGVMAGKMKVGKVNVDDAGSIAQAFGIMSIPTLIIFKDGKAVEKMVGVHTIDQLTEKVSKYL